MPHCESCGGYKRHARSKSCLMCYWDRTEEARVRRPCIDCGKDRGNRPLGRCRPCSDVVKAEKMLGFKHTDETRARMSAAASARHYHATERRDQIPALVAAGKTAHEIARIFDRSPAVIYADLDRLGIRKRPRRLTRPTDADTITPSPQPKED